MILRQAVRTVATGAPVPDGTGVEVRRRTDNGLIASLTTVNGEFEYIQNGNPGPFKVTVTTPDEVKITSSWNVGPAGAADVSGLPLYFRLWTDGIIPGLWNTLALTANGSGMTVSAATGGAIVQGILYDQRTATTPAIAPSDPTNPRIDTVVVRVIPAGAGADIEGTSVLAVKTGTPAASPVAPALTQTTALWEYALADVRVDAGVTAIGADKVTTRAVGATPGIGNEQIDDRVAALIVAGVGVQKSYDDTANTLTLDTAIRANQGATQKVTNTSTFQFNSTYYTVAADVTDTHKALIAPVGVAAIPNIWQFGTATSVSSGSPGPRTILTQTSSALATGVTWDWTADLAAVLPNSNMSGQVDLTITVNGSARTFRCTTNGGVTAPHVVLGGGQGIVGAGAGVSVTATVTWISGDSTAINGGQARVTFLPRT